MVESSVLKATKTIFCVSKIKKRIKITRSVIKINKAKMTSVPVLSGPWICTIQYLINYRDTC